MPIACVVLATAKLLHAALVQVQHLQDGVMRMHRAVPHRICFNKSFQSGASTQVHHAGAMLGPFYQMQ